MAFKTLSIRIPEEAHQELEKLAEERKQKVSDVARELIINGLKGGSPGMKDGLQWYCESCHQLLHEEYFDLEDIVDQLAKAMTAFYEDKQKRTCKHCGAVMEPPVPVK